MKLAGNRLIESIVGVSAKSMVHAIEGEIPFVLFEKPAKDSVFALITTAGVHLKTQGVFDVEAGDPTVRFVPSSCKEEDLMISHDHFDRTDADQDVNCVLPLTRLKELAAEEIIGGVAPTHYGLMGYIPDTKPLIEQSIPMIVKQLQEEKVDAVILNPG
jgi:D-proline reductase (dithiol) PrdB